MYVYVFFRYGNFIPATLFSPPGASLSGENNYWKRLLWWMYKICLTCQLDLNVSTTINSSFSLFFFFIIALFGILLVLYLEGLDCHFGHHLLPHFPVPKSIPWLLSCRSQTIPSGPEGILHTPMNRANGQKHRTLDDMVVRRFYSHQFCLDWEV